LNQPAQQNNPPDGFQPPVILTLFNRDMTTAEIAIIISIISAAIAGLSLGWNIYRDIVLKAKVMIDFGIRVIIQHGNQHKPEFVNICATNHGPGVVNLGMVRMKNSSWWRWLFRREEYGVVIHDYQNPLSGQLPCKLGVGEKLDLLFHYDADCMLKNGWSHIGLSDSFGRTHWAKSKQVRIAIKQWRKDFGRKK